MLSDGERTYTWRNGRELATLTKDGKTWNFTYDADGMRTGRVYGNTYYKYAYNGGQLSWMDVIDNILRFTYDASGKPVSVTYNGVLYYYVTNLQGDVVAILDSTGATVVTYTYDVWGKLLSTTDTTDENLGYHNPLRYRGYVYDNETGLYYLQSRYYNPEIGRFISADGLVSTGQGLNGNNMFAYCGNNPVARADKGGEWWNVVVGTVIGATIGFVSALITEIAESKLEVEGKEAFDWGDVFLSMGIGAAEGALTAMCPSAAGLISAGASMTETVIDGIEDGDSIREIVINTALSGMFGMASADSVPFVKGGTMNAAAKSIGNAFGKGVHPIVKKTARKAVRKAVKKIGKELATGFGETVMWNGVYELSSWYANEVFARF